LGLYIFCPLSFFPILLFSSISFTLKTIQFSCKLGEKFEETTADVRKTQTIYNFTDGALVQHQEWDGKESTITRKLEDGKLVVVCIMNNATCTWSMKK
ncbi:hypothetical protein FD754_020161, partial [Muntiacus muntjak]